MLINSLGFNGESYSRLQKSTFKNNNSNLQLKVAPVTDVFNRTTFNTPTTQTESTLIDSLISFLGRNNNNKPHSKKTKNSHHKTNHSNKPSKTHKNKQTHENRETVNKSKKADDFDNTLRNHNAKNGGKNAHKKPEKNTTPYIRPSYEYNNIFEERLVAEPKSTLKASLLAEGVHDINKAVVRVSSLSRYLKEDMVGFYTPDGDHWFEKAMPFILKGCEAKNIPVDEYFETALNFWNMMSLADNYWKSNDFVDYLNMMEPNPAVLATIEAVKTMQSMDSKQIAFTGYPSKIKYIDELDTCAYSGLKLKLNDDNLSPSAEHILPHSICGDEFNIDVNYFIVSSAANSNRGHIPLLEYLSGWDAPEYEEAKKVI